MTPSYTAPPQTLVAKTAPSLPQLQLPLPFTLIRRPGNLAGQPGKARWALCVLQRTTVRARGMADSRRVRTQILLASHDMDMPLCRTGAPFDLHIALTLELAPSWASLVPERHAFQVIQQTAPVVGEHLGILDSLLRPVLIPPRYIVLRVLEVGKLVAEAFLDEDRSVVLVDNRLLILHITSVWAQGA